MKKFVAVAGNIVVGKSTLVSMLSSRLGWQPFFEPVGENPYLVDFYRDMHQWSFHSQIFFLTRRLRSHRELLDHPTSAIQDRCVYEDAEVFAQNLYLQGLMNERDYASYHELYRVLSEFLPPPDLVVYLRSSVETLQQRMTRQGLAVMQKPHPPIEFELQDLAGKDVKLSSLKGKVVFLNFWATWCGPCRTEMPSMQRMYEKLKGEGLEILAVDLQEGKDQVQSFARELGLSFPILLDSTGKVGAHYNARAIPTTYLFDRKGFIIAFVVGAREWDTPEMLETLRRVLKESVSY